MLHTSTRPEDILGRGLETGQLMSGQVSREGRSHLREALLEIVEKDLGLGGEDRCTYGTHI